PTAERARGFAVAIGVIEHHHTLHRRPVDEEREVVRRALDRGARIVLRDRTADDDPRAPREDRQRGVENVAAHVVEVDIYALWTVPLQRFFAVFFLVVDRRTEPEPARDPLALGLAAGDPPPAAAFDPCDLPGDGADSARRSGHDDRVTRLH